MASLRAADGDRNVRRRRRRSSELDVESRHKSGGEETVTLEPDMSEVRSVRIERLKNGASIGSSSNIPTMTAESHATHASLKSTSSHRRKKDDRSSHDETKHRRRRKSTSKDDESATYVYGPPAARSTAAGNIISETRRLGRDGDELETENRGVHSDRDAGLDKVRTSNIRIVYVNGEEPKPRHKEHRPKSATETSHRHRRSSEGGHKSKHHHSRRASVAEFPAESPSKKSHTTKQSSPDSGPSLRRSNTISSHVPSHKEPHAPSVANTNASTRRSNWIGTFFGVPPPPRPREPEKLVDCLICLSDDIPRSKSAKLKCGHRMCQSCLKRIFRLSVTDPQHMPPKCCTSDHIPLKHVDKLFDLNFKKKWNLKFQEYTTRNWIYCPSRKCGEWIKPGNIHKEDGRKYGKCGRCKTKVCCLCNGKWHGTKECPKDEETNRLLEAAKQAGWQRCYSCRTMVELKEGCNHMTCRCTAEFCMLCGLKWKSCNCPWFNYDAVEADRLQHMRIPEVLQIPVPNAGQNRGGRGPRHINYHDEMNMRRRQERADEHLARRLQATGLGPDEAFNGDIGEIHGIGNNAGHFMNQDYVRAAHNILTGTFDQATAAANYVMGVAQARRPPPPGNGLLGLGNRYPPAPSPAARPAPAPAAPPILRRHTTREATYNAAPSTRPAERVVPRRSRTDYGSEAAVHAPLERSASAATRDEPRTSVLAGLRGARRGGNRVSAWRNHVEAGLAPPDEVSPV